MPALQEQSDDRFDKTDILSGPELFWYPLRELDIIKRLEHTIAPNMQDGKEDAHILRQRFVQGMFTALAQVSLSRHDPEMLILSPQKTADRLRSVLDDQEDDDLHTQGQTLGLSERSQDYPGLSVDTRTGEPVACIYYSLHHPSRLQEVAATYQLTTLKLHKTDPFSFPNHTLIVTPKQKRDIAPLLLPQCSVHTLAVSREDVLSQATTLFGDAYTTQTGKQSPREQQTPLCDRIQRARLERSREIKKLYQTPSADYEAITPDLGHYYDRVIYGNGEEQSPRILPWTFLRYPSRASRDSRLYCVTLTPTRKRSSAMPSEDDF